MSLLIIAGGKSSRLGVDKRFAKVSGVGLLEIVLKKSATIDFAEKFLCVEEELPALKFLAERYGVKILVDEIKNAGAMSGLANGLSKIQTDWALAVATDMPFFDFEILRPLTEKFSSTQAVVPVVNGKIQQLAAFYCQQLSEIFSRELRDGQRKLLTSIKKIPHEFAEISGEATFFNVNTPDDLKLACGRAENLRRKTPIISVVAESSGAGKTTYIERLVKNFSARGMRVGVIKSDVHGFNIDIEGKDSWRFQKAGAKSVAVVSPKGWFMINKTDERENFLTVADNMDVDLIFIESRAHGIFPQISIDMDEKTILFLSGKE